MELDKLFSIKDKVIVVTGSAQGNGRAIADGMLKLGAKLCNVDIRSHEKHYNNKINASVYKADLSIKQDMEKLIDSIVRDHGEIDVLINNAGVTTKFTDDNDKAFENWNKSHAINLRAPYYLSTIVSGYMPKGSSIINITSLSAEVGFKGNPSYVSSKGGLKQLSKALANDLGEKEIRVNSVTPGYIKTEMTATSYNDPSLRNSREGHMIIKRWGEPDDLLGACIYLSSKASSYVTGTDIIVDGGWLAKGMYG